MHQEVKNVLYLFNDTDTSNIINNNELATKASYNFICSLTLKKAAESDGHKRKLTDCPLNNWKDLRPALDVGAAADQFVTAVELIANRR